MARTQVWRRTVLVLRAADKGPHSGKILGPSINQYNFRYLTSFVDYAVTHGVVPDW